MVLPLLFVLGGICVGVAALGVAYFVMAVGDWLVGRKEQP